METSTKIHFRQIIFIFFSVIRSHSVKIRKEIFTDFILKSNKLIKTKTTKNDEEKTMTVNDDVVIKMISLISMGFRNEFSGVTCICLFRSNNNKRGNKMHNQTKQKKHAKLSQPIWMLYYKSNNNYKQKIKRERERSK